MTYRVTPRAAVRCIAAVVSTLAFAMVAGPVLAQKVDRPDVRVGDQWQFASGYVAPTEPNRTWIVTAVSATGIEGTENGQPLVLTRDLNEVDSPRRADSDQRRLSFPLEVGKQWSYNSEYLMKRPGVKGRTEGEVRVVSYEKVLVAAGEFDAFKLESRAEFKGTSHEGPVAGVGTMTYWYAPAARAVVRSIYKDQYQGQITTDLLGFKLQP